MNDAHIHEDDDDVCDGRTPTETEPQIIQSQLLEKAKNTSSVNTKLFLQLQQIDLLNNSPALKAPREKQMVLVFILIRGSIMILMP